jgi:predicted lipoprotein with Yx(FWY)xxD motif
VVFICRTPTRSLDATQGALDMSTPSKDRSERRSLHTLRNATLLASGAVLIGTGVATLSGASSSPTTITVAQNKTWGPTLTLKDGHTLYRLTKDPKNKSDCSGKCATVWVPVLLATGQTKPAGVGVSHLGSFTRAGGTKQVTYEGIPLYTFVGDKKAGQVTGNIKDTWGQWWSMNPASPTTAPKKLGGGSTTTTTSGGGIAY